jgi:AhpD family alkylhydroperoxidase
MAQHIYPPSSCEIAEKRRALAPETEKAIQAFSQQVFVEGALPAKIKQLIAVAVAHVTQCAYCIRGHTKAALRHGATREEQAIWVAPEMRAGGAYAHTALSLTAMDETETTHSQATHSYHTNAIGGHNDTSDPRSSYSSQTGIRGTFTR